MASCAHAPVVVMDTFADMGARARMGAAATIRLDYPDPMRFPGFSDRPSGLALIFHWRRLRVVLLLSLPLGLFVGLGWGVGFPAGLVRVLSLGTAALFAFGLFEQWPRRLPSWLARWALQVAAVAFVIPWTAIAVYLIETDPLGPPLWYDSDRLGGLFGLSMLGMLIAPWVALFALVRQKDAIARHQALAFELQRSELERRALDARMQLLQAQVQPHFLFNTLANVQALVEAGSPQASAVLRSLVAYLRAAVPRLHAPATTLGQELQLVRAYLELMHMRMPDRLRFSIDADDGALSLSCPSMTLQTLVENAVRHGIDPSEEGGEIRVEIRLRDGRCVARVSDTGVGLAGPSQGLGTGLATLRERLRLTFGDDAQVRVSAREPHGVDAEFDFPARSTDA